MVQISAREAEGPFPFHSKKASLSEFAPAFRTRRITEDPEDDDVAAITAGLATAR